MKITQQTSGLSYFQKIICAGEKIAGTQTAKNSYEQTITEKTMFPKYNNIIRRFAQIVNEAVKKKSMAPLQGYAGKAEIIDNLRTLFLFPALAAQELKPRSELFLVTEISRLIETRA